MYEENKGKDMAIAIAATFIAGVTIGALSTAGYFERKASILNDRWEAATNTTLKSAEAKTAKCAPKCRAY